MNVFIMTDLEGIGKVTSIDYMDTSSRQYEVARKLLTEEINYVGKLCKKYGADNIYYLDGHGGGGNVYEDKIYDYLKKVDIATWQNLLKDGKIDCQIELGSHARAGTIGGFLDHTINSRQWFSYKVNQREYSELAMHVSVCSRYSVPIAAVIGDETACEQAKQYIKNIVTAPIKKADSRNKCVDKANAEQIIENAISAALANYKEIDLLHESFPAEIELTFYRTDMCEETMSMCECEFERVNARTLRKFVNEINSYDDLKFQ